MAYTNITPTRPSPAGVVLAITDGDNTNGNKIPNDGRVLLLLQNTSGSNTATVTIATPQTVGGLAVADQAIALAVSQSKICGPYPPEIYNQPAGDTDEGCLRLLITGAGAATVNVTPIQT